MEPKGHRWCNSIGLEYDVRTAKMPPATSCSVSFIKPEDLSESEVKSEQTFAEKSASQSTRFGKSY